LGVTVAEFITPKPAQYPGDISLINNSHGTATVPSNVYAPENWPRDLPIKQIGDRGPDGWSLWIGEVIKVTERPPGLAGVPKAYAAYAPDDSMEVRYFAGELLHIDPSKPLAPGDFVLVQIKPAQGSRAPRTAVKRLVSRTGGRVILEQFKPAKRIEIKEADVVSIDKIVGTGS
jgi:hypothetical protein